MRRISLMIVLLAACSNESATRPTPAVLDGSWHHVRAADEPPGFLRQFTLTLSGTTLSGTGTWQGEAGPQGALTVTGTVNGDDIHLDLAFTVTLPQPAQGFVQHFDGRLSTPSDLVDIRTMIDDLLERMNELNQGQRLDFYECLAHDLTVAAREVWSSEADDAEKVDELKWLNEIQHRVVSKIAVLRKNQHEWTESDSYADFQYWISQNERNRQRVTASIRRALRVAQSQHDV